MLGVQAIQGKATLLLRSDVLLYTAPDFRTARIREDHPLLCAPREEAGGAW